MQVESGHCERDRHPESTNVDSFVVISPTCRLKQFSSLQSFAGIHSENLRDSTDEMICQNQNELEPAWQVRYTPTWDQFRVEMTNAHKLED